MAPPGGGIIAAPWSVRATGILTVPAAGTYTLTTNADDGVRIWINDVLTVDKWTPGTATGKPFTTTGPGPVRIRMDYTNTAGTGFFTVNWHGTNLADQTIPGAVLSPDYNLVTSTTTDDNSAQTPAQRTDTQYAQPWLGLATASIQDPANLNLTTKTAYEPVGTGYLRPTATALPSASVTNAAQSRTTVYYGDTEPRANPCVGGSTAISQGGMAKIVTDPTPATGGAIAHEVVYDGEGHVLASRVVSDGAVWTCTTYDLRYRVTQVAIPAVTALGTTARTINTSYAVGAPGNPLVSSVSDSAGVTITATTDLLGRTVAYKDTKNTITTTTYDPAGRVAAQVTTPAGTALKTRAV
jgi:YD repeat-containing protein